MDLKWRRTNYGSWQLFWDERTMRCAELFTRDSDQNWGLTLSLRVVPLGFNPDRAYFGNLEAAQEYTENLVTVLIIGGHHERN